MLSLIFVTNHELEELALIMNELNFCIMSPERLIDLFQGKKLVVPSYQRAYAWRDEQLKQFVADLLEIKDKQYYFGHFILEETGSSFEIIDGQQRLTTFILFLIVCRFFLSGDTSKLDLCINNFETVNYDQSIFLEIKKQFLSDVPPETLQHACTEQQTLSLQRMLNALQYFKGLFSRKDKAGLCLQFENISGYTDTLFEAHISSHITDTKAVAVQIFELQNTRGIKLNLIEKVKSKLMKAIYVSAIQKNSEEIVKIIQQDFSFVYEHEETVSVKSFRGELSLEQVLFHHLRIIDDGTKPALKDRDAFTSPRKSGSIEESILNYVDSQINQKTNVVEYVVNLAANFRTTVELVSTILPLCDEINRLIGDLMILDTRLSLEFFILLQHKGFHKLLKESDVLLVWEKLLFTRDFHEKYYKKWYRDDFESVFKDIASCEDSAQVINLLNRYVNDGFRKDDMDNGSLKYTVLNYINKNESEVLGNAFFWWLEKMVYIMYKYEISQSADLHKLRHIMKKGDL